jgi:sucrose-phosphate synthase
MPSFSSRSRIGSAASDGLYVVHLSVHGLVRSRDLELGRDADTGGQVRYIIELARELSAHPRISRLDVITRLIEDPRVDASYSVESEPIGPRGFITRLRFGPRRYLRKEKLWPHLGSLADQALYHFSRLGRVPDVIHAHYADAGAVGADLAAILGVPFVFTGHSLGRVKRARCLARGLDGDSMELQYQFRRRIEAEESALDNAAFVVASTQHEIDEQYSGYDRYEPSRMRILSPGVSLSRFEAGSQVDPSRLERFDAELGRFLRDPEKPIVCAIARLDPKKNLEGLIHAFGTCHELRNRANLLLVAGTRDDPAGLERSSREVLTQILALIDKYDLYGSVAYPKHHEPRDVPVIYRLVARSRGIFVNPAFSEPFGLTLLEAAASGVPVVATCHGGPREIIDSCRNGRLIDPHDEGETAGILLDSLSDPDRWDEWSRNGIEGVERKYSWKTHVAAYLDCIDSVRSNPIRPLPSFPNRLPYARRAIVSDIDNTLTGDAAGIEAFVSRLAEARPDVAFGIATGRDLESARRELECWGLPEPDVFITSVGSEIYYGPNMVEDRSWAELINYRWNPRAIEAFSRSVPGIRPQGQDHRRRFKLSFDVDPTVFPGLRDLKAKLRRSGIRARVIYSHGAFLDFLPLRASKGHALRHVALKWGLPASRILVAGDSGNDAEMLTGDTLGVVVANYAAELEKLRGDPRVYFASRPSAWGVLEGLEYYEFIGATDASWSLRLRE